MRREGTRLPMGRRAGSPKVSAKVSSTAEARRTLVPTHRLLVARQTTQGLAGVKAEAEEAAEAERRRRDREREREPETMPVIRT